MKLFNRPDFDHLCQNLPKSERERVLGRYLKLELALAFLKEKKVTASVSDLILLAKSVDN